MLRLSNASPESQAHCLVAQAATLSKPVKELVLPTHKLPGIKYETLTIYKNNAGKFGLATLSQFVIFGNIIKCSSS